MTNPVHPFRKYVVSTAIVTSLALTPLVGSSVSAQSNAPSDNGSSVQVSESNLLTIGDRGQAVSSLQSELASHGYYNYNVDGVYGPITKSAVASFQSSQGLAVDGIAGPNTKSALSSGSASASTSSEQETVTTGTSASVSTSGSAADSEIVAAAENLVGIPYEYGGTTRAALDSSGFINETFEQVGKDVERTHSGIWAANGTHVSSPSVGDVVFFEGTYDTAGASHSGIYIGDNKMIHAGSSGVEVSNFGLDYWQNHYIGAKSIQ
ncbi:C40 family peptidase [Salimicrobium flavidum]|uniref:Cell wall-associated hydrolase, NlpC family n=1 Tax=Salimicrobium flavidum TaxID=570947 RepID=A0A1N7JFM5_9BACI|nr:NlpC/P60 family protein [Salimicrobium flavidum]SIS48163.1 Cell wall-associated hydrolase, NlpC family [Salimicrobium flavidum]